jgi:hypothetical protein
LFAAIKKIPAKILNFFLPYYKKYTWAFLLSFLNALALLIYTFWIVNLPLVLAHEYSIMSEILHIKHLVLHPFQKTEPITEKYLLIDVSRNAQLVYGDNDSLTNEAITDRRKLANALEILNNNADKIKFIVCDILFDMPLGEDSVSKASDKALANVIQKLSEKNIIVVPVEYYTKEDSISKSIFKSKIGLAQYNPSFNNSFYKYRFIEGGKHKQIPLILFEEFNNTKASKYSFLGLDLFKLNNEVHLNRIIPTYKYYPEDLIVDESYFYLGEFDDYMIGDNNPIIIIGSFEKDDFHNTLIGKMNGSLILINLLEGLKMGATKLSWNFIFLLFLCYFFVAYNTLFKQANHDLQHASHEHKSIRKSILQAALDWLAHHRNFVMLFSFMLIALFVFNQYIYFLSVATYILILELILKFYRKLKRKKQQ